MVKCYAPVLQAAGSFFIVFVLQIAVDMLSAAWQVLQLLAFILQVKFNSIFLIVKLFFRCLWFNFNKASETLYPRK